MLGLGEGEEEVRQVLADLIAVGCDICTSRAVMLPGDAICRWKKFIHPICSSILPEWGKRWACPVWWPALWSEALICRGSLLGRV